MLSATFDDWGGGANDPAFSVDLTSSTAIFRSPEILQIFRGNCYTSQGDPDSSFPLWAESVILDWLVFSLPITEDTYFFNYENSRYKLFCIEDLLSLNLVWSQLISSCVVGQLSTGYPDQILDPMTSLVCDGLRSIPVISFCWEFIIVLLFRV